MAVTLTAWALTGRNDAEGVVVPSASVRDLAS